MKRETFIEKSREIFGFKYDYSEVLENISRSDIVTIILDGNRYSQRVSNHLLGKSPEKISKRYSNDDFIEKSREIWGDRFSYDSLDYINIESKIKIYDKYQGRFIVQKAIDHLRGRESNYMTEDDFIRYSKDISNNEYDYSETKYKNLTTKVNIKCIEHDLIFSVIPHLHLSKAIVCPNCNYSTYSKEIRAFLNKRDIRYDEQYRFNNNSTRFDFYLPRLNLILDYEASEEMNDLCESNYVNILSSKDIDYIKKYLISILNYNR